MEDAGAAGGVGGADSLLRAAFRAGGEGAGGVREGVPVLIELPDRFESKRGYIPRRVLSALWVSLYSQDLLQAAKLGSIKAAKYRVPVAAEAFFAGRSEKVMFCGGKIRDFSGESMTEAEYGG